jgi:hypothetical protein
VLKSATSRSQHVLLLIFLQTNLRSRRKRHSFDRYALIGNPVCGRGVCVGEEEEEENDAIS